MPLKLSDKEIKQRLIRLRNLEKLYANLKNKYAALKKDYDELKELVVLQAKVIEDQTLRIEELEKMVFGHRGHRENSVFIIFVSFVYWSGNTRGQDNCPLAAFASLSAR